MTSFCQQSLKRRGSTKRWDMYKLQGVPVVVSAHEGLEGCKKSKIQLVEGHMRTCQKAALLGTAIICLIIFESPVSHSGDCH